MLEVLQRAVDDVRSSISSFEPERFEAAVACSLVEAFAELERLGAAGKALAARQVVATGAWKHYGAHRDAASWLATTTGDTVGAARSALDTADRLAELPATEAAMRAGELSTAQVDAIAAAASVDPCAERQLLERSRHDGVRGLRNECARVKAAACSDSEERYEHIRATRSLRTWTDPDGAGRIDIRGPVDETARVLAAIAPFEKALFETARTDDRQERSDALAFDALVALADAHHDRRAGGGSCDAVTVPKLRDTTVVVRIDHTALVRGRTEPGEVCEVVGSGPIPVSVAQGLLDDAFIKAVIVDGTDVLTVSHPGRTINARLRTAVDELHPECAIAGCHVTHNLEIDHNQPIEEQGRTELANLNRLCTHHHRHKHRHRLRLEGEPGRMRFVPAPEPVVRC